MIIYSAKNFNIKSSLSINQNKIGKNIFTQNYDTFVRTTSFSGLSKKNDESSFNNFIKWAKENDFLSNITDIADYTGKILGSGFEGEIIEIPNCDKWVIKTFKRSKMVNIARNKPEIIEIKDFSPELNVGQIIAKIEIPHGKNYSKVYYILKRQSGISYGVGFDDSSLLSERNVRLHHNLLKTLAEFPQSSFDECIKNANTIDNLGYEFDCTNPHNFMLDIETKSINFIDINDLNVHNKNPYGDILFALLGGDFALNILNSDCSENIKNTAINYSNSIINKYFSAMKKNNKKFEVQGLFTKLLDTNILDSVLKTNSREERIVELKKQNLM